MKKRLSRTAALTAAAALIITGCLWAAGKPEDAAPEEEQIVLHVMHNKQEAPETYHKLAEAFHQKHPDITVESTPVCCSTCQARNSSPGCVLSTMTQ